MSIFPIRLIATLLVLVLAGCASTRGFPERPESVPEKLTKLQEKFFLPGMDVLEEFDKQNDEKMRRTYRNNVVHGRLLAIDMQYGLFKEAIYGEGVSSSLIFDILGVSVGAAGTAVTGAEASRILSALSGGLSGTSTSINKNLYYQRTLPALLALMDAERTKVRVEILEGLVQTSEKYPLGRALSDLERYLQAGSIPGALSAVTATAGETKAEAEKKLEIVRKKDFVDPQLQSLVDELLDLVEKLPSGVAFKILQAPPSKLDSFVSAAIKGRLGGKELSVLQDKEQEAKKTLKMVLVLINDRSKENIVSWKAAMTAELKGN